MVTWVFAYDIRDNGRRTRVSGRLQKEGLRLQKSVFLVQGTQESVQALVKKLGDLIDVKTDRICAWPLRVHWQADQVCHPASAAPLREDVLIG